MNYTALGLRHNPFAADQGPGVAEDLYVERRVDPPRPGDRRLIQVSGPGGSGKTALLLHWQRTVPGPYLRIEGGWRRWRPVPLAPVAYWDEDSPIPRVMLRRALVAAAETGATIVLATSRDCSRPARRAGLEVQPVRLPAPTGPTVTVWAARRIAAAALPGVAPCLEVGGQLAETVAGDCDGSWRVVADRLRSWAEEQATAVTER